MKSKEIELFVPGRLCLMGEHSDWAGGYRKTNNKIEKGYAIVTGIEEGIYANVKSSDKFIVKFENDESKEFVCDMNLDKLRKVAEDGGYWSYVAGVASCIKEQYNVGGLEITITKETIPTKKGLSSSAAICVLVTRAFNQIYNLHLNTIGEMNMAYLGEITTPSRCGRLDQACAFGKRPVLMTFDGDRLDVKNIKIGNDLYFVFADLMSQKDTIKILASLNKCFPFATSEIESNTQKGLGELNKKIIMSSLEAIEKGDIESLGKLMIKSQEIFDKYVAPSCMEELTSPILHKTINDEKLKSLSYGGKGVGSQGDGTVQFLAKDYNSQQEIKQYLEDVLGMNAYTLTINKTKTITKAIIPVAGNGSRMYPITKLLRKAFLPIIDKDGILKPAIMSLLEELDEAGIEKICLIIDEEDRKDYEKFFESELSEDLTAKLSTEMLEYESKIHRIGKKIEYVYQKEKLGLGHAVSLCESFAGSDPVLLVLGDQLYRTDTNMSCTTQLLNNYTENNKMMVSVFEIPLKDVSKYGILCGSIEKGKNYYNVDQIYEKPDPTYARDYLYTTSNGQKKYYSVFGEYIITKSVFDKLRENIKNGVKERGEYQLTSVLEDIRKKDGMIAFIPDGEMLDIGNVESYRRTLVRKQK